MKSFEDLEVWQYCTKLRRQFSELARRLPKEETFRLADQIIRASRSVTN
ncbi:four helix bundle protein, partial [candidate division KSB1 bacterium]|nr:four helix bundle protein [candidate division KSB1 bacterium]NIS23257.1 four helix bundle protein [candidate division KSB1 bacterium]NIT70139.1 four helix bundle protein [candidate division KSB1 bacterium]NIU89394.1 four helix bundle protein [candidate division KSB1 bacterium]NIW17628.1 four helix bundle protein [candidate division KSB1 bacterium]